jgi:hypothetical protein
MDVGEIFAALSAHVADEAGDTDDEKVKAVVAAMRGHESPAVKAIAQKLLDAGAGRKAGEHGKRIKALETELEEAKGIAAELQEKIDTAEQSKGKPSEKEAALEKERDRWKAKAEKADTELKAERDGRKTDRVGTRALSVVSELKGQVDEDYLAEVLTPRIAKRLRPTDEDVEFLAEDETPYEGDDKARTQALAADVLKQVPDKYRLRDMRPGGGVDGKGGRGTVTVEQIENEKRLIGNYGL